MAPSVGSMSGSTSTAGNSKSNPLMSKKKWKAAQSARPVFDVQKFAPSIIVWSEAECNVSTGSWVCEAGANTHCLGRRLSAMATRDVQEPA